MTDLCSDANVLIGPYVTRRKGNKENLHLKEVTMIDTITGWFEVVRYDDKRAISIEKLFETTWISRYTRPMEITYDQGKKNWSKFQKTPN